MSEVLQNVRNGYKPTEIGVIPEDWDLSTVGREFDIKLGKMLNAGTNVGAPKLYLGNKAVQWDRIDISNLATVPMTRADLDAYRLRNGDLLVCEGGEVGRAAIWDAPIEECYYQKALHRLRPLRGFDSKLMAAFLRLWSDRGLFANYVTQTSIAHLPREKFLQMPMPVPPFPEQSAIATALSDVDALLGALDRLIAKKSDLKQAAMQQLLTGQTRLPGFHGEWAVKRLGDVCRRITTGKLDANAMMADGDFPFFTCARENYWIDKYAFDYEALLVSGNGANVGYVHYYNGKFNAYQRTYVISEFTADVQFIKTFLVRNIQDRIRVEVNAGNTPYITMGTLTEMEITIPPTVREQTAIAEVLTDMDSELAALEQRREKTRALKQGMMQELLTGRVRLPIPTNGLVETTLNSI